MNYKLIYRGLSLLAALLWLLSDAQAQSSQMVKDKSNLASEETVSIITNRIIEGNAELMDQSFKKTTLSDLFASHRGKIIYLDFWASWCGPCLAEMPYSARLKEKIKDSNIVMMYISLDEDFNRWISMSKRIGLDQSKSFVLVNVAGDEFFKKVNIAYIPRYVIVDKEGKVHEANAQRPSQKGLAAKLEKLSQKK